MKRLSLLLLSLLVTACSSSSQNILPSIPDSASSAASSIESVSPVTPAPSEEKSLTLVDQDYGSVSGLSGMPWLKAINAKKITTSSPVSAASIDITVSRGSEKTSWGAVGVYIAPIKNDPIGNFEYPDESAYGKRLHFIDAKWSGNCKRNLDANSSFGVLHSHDANTVQDFSALPLTLGDDGCDKGSETLNLLSMLNESGLYLGFAPSGYAYHVKVVLRYSGGDVTAISPF